MFTQRLRLSRKTTRIFLILSGVIVLFLMASLCSLSNLPASFAAKTNRITRENQQPGTTRWQSLAIAKGIQAQTKALRLDIDKTTPQKPAPKKTGTKKLGQVAAAKSTTAGVQPTVTSQKILPADSSSNWNDTTIKGYADSTSINAGQNIHLYVSTSQASYNMEIYRMGWYGGAGARLIQSVSNMPGINQPDPTPQTGTGLIEANWQSTYTLQTDNTWVSGVYLVKLIAADGTVAYIIFVIRNDGAAADIVFQIPINTYQAYNNWGGKSLYDYNSDGGRAYKVSYDRPYADDGTGLFFAGDYNMLLWLEENGYNVTYATSLDTLTNPNLLNGRKIFLSDYHDEYWSKGMRDNLTNAFNQGKDLAFFSANNIYWQIRFENSTAGVANRVITCYKDVTLDPLAQSNPLLTTVNWRDPPVNEPENALLGVMYESQLGGGNTVPWVVQNSSNWVYNGTGLKDGDSIPGLVGYEYDRVYNNGQTPAGLVSLSYSPLVDLYGNSSHGDGSVYQAANGAFVFTAGTIYWSWKLNDNSYQHHGVDWRVQQITANVLNTMVSGSTPTPAPSPTSEPPNQNGNYTIYGDALNSSWANWSWSSTINFNDTHPYSGKHDISWKPNAGYACLSLNDGAGVTTYGYPYLSFAVEATATNEAVWVNVVDGNGYNLIALPVSSYGGNLVQGSYKVYNIPIIDLGAYNSTITGVQFCNQTTVEPAMYIDALMLNTGATVTPTPTSINTPTPTPTTIPSPTSTPTSTSSTPTPTPTTLPSPTPTSTTVTPTATSGNGYTVYDEALANGWQNWSWGSTVDFADASHPRTGTYDLAWTPTAGYAGLYLAMPSGMSTSGYTVLTIAVEASQANESAAIDLLDASNNILATVPLSNYGGNLVQGQYVVYTIPLSDLNASNKTIGAIQITDPLSTAQPVMYLDDIAFQ